MFSCPAKVFSESKILNPIRPGDLGSYMTLGGWGACMAPPTNKKETMGGMFKN